MPKERKKKAPVKSAAAPRVAVPPVPDPEEPLTEALISSPWTRSPGRARFRTLVQQAIDRGAQRPNYQFALLYLDLDRFAIVNDSLGREAGDQLLLEVTRRLRSTLRPEDVVTRLREDEYLIFLDNIQQHSNTLEIVSRIRDGLRAPLRLNHQDVFVSASAGIALGPRGYSQAEDIVRDAEAAMHRSKTKGPGSYEIFDLQMHEDARKLLRLETELREAMDLRQLRLQYEPIVALDTGRVAGFESLLRWLHPRRGMVYPGEFLPLADQTGLILPLTRWVLQEACRQLQKWQEQLPDFASLWLSVNLSPIYITRCDFAQELAACVQASGVEASNLVMEITESQLLENADNILKGFATLHDTGIKLWIDDFGAGYSSLSYLVKFPIHSLKIDRSFISKLVHDDKSTTIAKAIVSLGKSLGVNVIAEGVETRDQFEYLRSLDCPYGQGHYFSSSLDAETIAVLFANRQEHES